MAHRDWQDHWRGLRLPVHGHRIRVVVALIGFLLSIGAPIVVLSTPGFTVDGRLAARPLHNLTGVGVTGALPGDPLPSNTVLSGVSGGSVGAGPSETAVPHAVPCRGVC